MSIRDIPHLEDALISAFRSVIKDAGALRKLALAELQWLNLRDLEQLTGFEAQTLEKWRDNGWITMFKPGDSREWRTSLVLWRQDEAILIEAGLLDERGRKPSADQRKKRISELKRQKLRVLSRSTKAAA